MNLCSATVYTDHGLQDETMLQVFIDSHGPILVH